MSTTTAAPETMTIGQALEHARQENARLIDNLATCRELREYDRAALARLRERVAEQSDVLRALDDWYRVRRGAVHSVTLGGIVSRARSLLEPKP